MQKNKVGMKLTANQKTIMLDIFLGNFNGTASVPANNKDLVALTALGYVCINPVEEGSFIPTTNGTAYVNTNLL